MKIIGVNVNYASRREELGNVKVGDEPIIFMKPDSSILKDGKPFFLPDFSKEVCFQTNLVVRICRLGRHISPRFAPRYYDAVTVGVDFTAGDICRKLSLEGNPWELSKVFDNSAVLGDFVSLDQTNNEAHKLDFCLMIDGVKVQYASTADMLFKVDEIIAYVSQYMTLKIGDLLFTGSPSGVGKTSIGQHFEGYLSGNKVLDFNVR